MSYYKAEEVLPEHIIKEIQKYVDGHSIYVPKSQIIEKIGEKVPKLYLSLKREMSRFILNIWMAALLPNFQQNIIW